MKKPLEDFKMKNIFIRFLVLGVSLFSLDTFAQAGKTIFDSKCLTCHTLGKGKLIGPDLKGITQRRKLEWIKKMIKDPETMLKTDDTAKKLLQEYNNIPMINMGLKDAEITAVIEYLKSEDKKK